MGLLPTIKHQGPDQEPDELLGVVHQDGEALLDQKILMMSVIAISLTVCISSTKKVKH